MIPFESGWLKVRIAVEQFADRSVAAEGRLALPSGWDAPVGDGLLQLVELAVEGVHGGLLSWWIEEAIV